MKRRTAAKAWTWLTAGLVLAGTCFASATATATPPNATYTVTIGSSGGWSYPDDTPAAPFVDKDGTFYFQESHSLYGAKDSRQWTFYSGTDISNATRNAVSDAVNPANSQDKNNDTTWRCNNSPTGLQSTYTTDTANYAQKNYCDLMGVWVDPDTGDWYGLVHNEFTPEPFGANSFSHYDAIDYAVSHNQGKVWTITGHAITSPYSTTRGDTTAFPNGTFDYGDGDPRLFVDQASGYFYVQYDSRIVPKAGTAGSSDDLAHVARAPMSAKMATGSWTKWYNGSWSQPGIGGLESNLVPATTANPSGYTPVANDYNPANAGTVDQMIAANTLPSKSPLATMNIAYDAYLGLYIGEPEVVDQSQQMPQQYYVTDDLTTQKWYLVGDSGSYTSESWYRFFLDSANLTDFTNIGKSFRSYCSFYCNNGASGTYANETVDSSAPAAPLVDPAKSYTIGNSSGQLLTQVSGSSATTSQAASGSNLQSWTFAGNGDGSYRIVNAGTGQALGVDSTTTTNRAWGTAPTVTALNGSPTVGQQWFLIKNRSSATNAPDGTFRLVNRYSGLTLGLSTTTGRLSETTPVRAWTNTTGNAVGGTRTAADQTLTLTQTGTGTETVVVTNPGSRAGTVGTATSLQISASDSQGKALTYSATGLPAGLSINSSGKISGTPTTAGTSTVTVTASSGTASASTSFTWTVTRPGTTFEGELYTSSSNVIPVSDSTASGGSAVGYIVNGSWLGYSTHNTSGVTGFSARISSGGSGGTIQIRSGSQTGTLLGSVTVPVTGGWSTWQNVSTTLTASASGPLYLVFVGPSGYLFNVDTVTLS